MASSIHSEFNWLLRQSLSTMSIMDCQSWRQKSNNLSNENINTGISVVFKTKSELKFQNELILQYHFPGSSSLNVFNTEIIWCNNWLLIHNWRSRKTQLRCHSRTFDPPYFDLTVLKGLHAAYAGPWNGRNVAKSKRIYAYLTNVTFDDAIFLRSGHSCRLNLENLLIWYMILLNPLYIIY